MSIHESGRVQHTHRNHIVHGLPFVCIVLQKFRNMQLARQIVRVHPRSITLQRFHYRLLESPSPRRHFLRTGEYCFDSVVY